jgi:O-acetyl-ADP-ribose deacetylase (regulator of RNase III)
VDISTDKSSSLACAKTDMALQVYEGDLFANAKPGSLIVHGCNAQGKMASGFAAELRKRFPPAYTVYKAHYDQHGLKLGDVNGYEDSSGHTIVNAITQERYGRDPGVVYVNYDAVYKALTTVATHVKESRRAGTIVHLPFIGGGLANGDRALLMDIFVDVFKDVDARLWVV